MKKNQQMPKLGGNGFNPKKMILWMFLFSLCSLAMFVALYSCSSQTGYTSTIDLENVNLVQLEGPKEGDSVALIHTDLGDLTVQLYPEQAPETVKNFIQLAENGYYNDTYLFGVVKGVYAEMGAKDSSGNVEDSTAESEHVIRELSEDLWPFRGALCSMTVSQEGGVWDALKGKMKYFTGSRFLICDTVEITDDMLKSMRSNNENNPIVDTFEKLGGIPNFSQQMTIFGQVYGDFSVLDALTEVETVSGSEENALQPKTDVKIQSIEILSYTEE